MTVPFLIIDGYNLMHAVGLARQQYGQGDLERSRNAFINFLSLAISEKQSARTIVVFDAFDAPDNLSRKYQQSGMTILFAPSGCDADSVIEEMIENHSAPKQVLVVSSDHRIQRAARKRRAKSIDSDLFLIKLEKLHEKNKSTKEALPPQKLGQHISDMETDYWLEEFGSIPTTMKEAGVEPFKAEPINTQKTPASKKKTLPNKNKDTQEKPETDEWLEIFNNIQTELNSMGDADYWQQQIDDVIKEEGEP